MSVLKNKNIILGITGGIAAYKSAELIRLLIKQGAQVQVVMTDSAKEFITPLTFQALSGREVRDELFDLDAEAGMGHIELARWADLILIAPATANTLAKIAHGIADNLLTTLCLATKASLLLAPAMNQQMWRDETTQKNIKILSQCNNISICGPAEGEQACGDIGPGRMVEPSDILAYYENMMGPGLESSDESVSSKEKKSMSGIRVLITAGPTIEDIDPVRYLTNRSSGKMGYAIAHAALEQGAFVSLISGPSALDAPTQAELTSVRSAQQMYDAVFQKIDTVDRNHQRPGELS